MDSNYKEAPGNVAIEDDSHLEALVSWVQAGQSDTTKLFAQLSHGKLHFAGDLNHIN